jgi:uncharacterized protein involved in tolerance to divalent cations
VKINAPLEKVWEINMDLSKIAEYHPRVNDGTVSPKNAQRHENEIATCEPYEVPMLATFHIRANISPKYVFLLLLNYHSF